MRTTLDLPDYLYKQAKIVAVERGTTLRMLFTLALARELGVKVPSASSPKTEGNYSILPVPGQETPKTVNPKTTKPPRTRKKPVTQSIEDNPPWLL